MNLTNAPISTDPVRDDSSPNGVRVDVVTNNDTTIATIDVGPTNREGGIRPTAPGASGPSPGPGQHAR